MVTLDPDPFGQRYPLRKRVRTATAALTRPLQRLVASVRQSYIGSLPAWRVILGAIILGLMILGAVQGGGGEGGG